MLALSSNKATAEWTAGHEILRRRTQVPEAFYELGVRPRWFIGFLGEVLQRRLDKHDRSGNAYLAGLELEPSRIEIAALARELTVGETYFFRNNEQFRALAERLLLTDRVRLVFDAGYMQLAAKGKL